MRLGAVIVNVVAAVLIVLLVAFFLLFAFGVTTNLSSIPADQLNMFFIAVCVLFMWGPWIRRDPLLGITTLASWAVPIGLALVVPRAYAWAFLVVGLPLAFFYCLPDDRGFETWSRYVLRRPMRPRARRPSHGDGVVQR